LEKLLADETIPERQDLEGLKLPISKLVKVHRWTAIHRRSDANPFHEVHPASTAWSQLSGRLLAGPLIPYWSVIFLIALFVLTAIVVHAFPRLEELNLRQLSIRLRKVEEAEKRIYARGQTVRPHELPFPLAQREAAAVPYIEKLLARFRSEIS
jgi:hypothetical protein